MMQFLSITLFPLLMIVAGAGDALSMRIPNWLTILIALTFFPMAFFTAMPIGSFGFHLAIGIVLFGLGFLLFTFGIFGGGDAKLLAAAGLWLGWPGVVDFLVMTGLAGGLLALTVCAWSLLQMDRSLAGGPLFTRLAAIKPNVPYGYAFAIGAILAFPQSWWVQIAI